MGYPRGRLSSGLVYHKLIARITSYELSGYAQERSAYHHQTMGPSFCWSFSWLSLNEL